MQEREAIPLTGLTMCYLGPLVLVLLPGYREESNLMKRSIREGLLIFFSSIVLLVLIRMLSSVPIIGALFQALLILCWMTYLVLIVWIITSKYGDPFFQIPFLTTYADQLERN